MMDHMYVLEDKKVRPARDLEDFQTSFEDRRILKTVLAEDDFVSTIFLGINHNMNGAGDPVVFETMHFPSNEQTRATTYDDAVECHWTMVEQMGGKRPIERRDVTLDEELFQV